MSTITHACGLVIKMFKSQPNGSGFNPSALRLRLDICAVTHSKHPCDPSTGLNPLIGATLPCTLPAPWRHESGSVWVRGLNTWCLNVTSHQCQDTPERSWRQELSLVHVLTFLIELRTYAYCAHIWDGASGGGGFHLGLFTCCCRRAPVCSLSHGPPLPPDARILCAEKLGKLIFSTRWHYRQLKATWNTWNTVWWMRIEQWVWFLLFLSFFLSFSSIFFFLSFVKQPAVYCRHVCCKYCVLASVTQINMLFKSATGNITV